MAGVEAACPPPALSSGAVYAQLQKYEFLSDQEFLQGLAQILGHPDVSPTEDELSQNDDLVLQAKCFYLTRKLNLSMPIDPSEYLAWARDQTHVPSSTQHGESSTTTSIPGVNARSAQASPAQETPPYPSSFDHLVDLITRNEPIPGIETIPTTVLEAGSSKVDKTPRRRKPWETETDAEAEAPPAGASSTTFQEDNVIGDSRQSTSDGVVKILQPNAIPESGLLSKE
jgi:hypothetical protein